MPSSAAQERWVILSGLPNVVKDEEAKRAFPPGADIAVAFSNPPRATVLKVPYRVSSPPCFDHPYVAAADASGLLLLCSTEPYDVYFAIYTYHLCDARTGEAARLGDHNQPMGLHGRNAGLMVKGDGSCVVAELQPPTTGERATATLLRYAVGKGHKWVEKTLALSPPLQQNWCGEGVVSDGTMLWWVDLRHGLLGCDPFADEPELVHVPLPQIPDLLLPLTTVDSSAHHCVRMSGGRLRYAVIHGSANAPIVSTWALINDRWNPERRSVPLAEVWADESYLNTMLPWSVPALALLHPMDPDMVYFFLDNRIFSVDLRRKKVMECGESGMPDQPGERFGIVRPSHLVHAWHYDPSSNRSDFESSYLRGEKEFAARNRMIGLLRATRKQAKELKRFRDDLIREQQEAIRMKALDCLLIHNVSSWR
ncbi:hypothetical protein EJB05_00799, partial [Eragrostis curvula]